jgi:hypothetical protein
MIDQRDLLAVGDLITPVYKVRHPASILAYKILGILTADLINTIYIYDKNNFSKPFEWKEILNSTNNTFYFIFSWYIKKNIRIVE